MEKQTITKDETALLQLVANFDAAWNDRDARALAALFNEDADFQYHTGKTLRGRRQIEKYYAAIIFPNLPAGLRHESARTSIRFIQDDIVIGDGHVLVVDVDEPDPEKCVYLDVLATTILVKRQNQWLFSAVRLMIPIENQ